MSALNHMKIGFIGLGLMGKPMCRLLKAAGADLIVTNRSEPAMTELAREEIRCGANPAEVAAEAELIIIMVSDTAAVEQVITGSNGILDSLQPGSLVIDMGTTLMTSTLEFSSKVKEKSADYVDAPVSGGTIGAESGSLTIMVGGDTHAVDRARPVLEVLGSRITHVGAIGAGQVAKAANQVIVGLSIGAVAEALALAKAAGVDPGKVREALQGGFADSRILEIHGQRMVNQDFTPGARATIQRKDMDQALVLAERFGLEMPATSLSRELYDRLIASGGANLDHAGLFTILEKKNV
ncbi:MAG: NAD(P)-dependent oxidoreductase [Desulfobulbaceae bacterium]|nr:MAG: NAD(P)-dependent oxidoreductase [Desulfobulbaceae bacterium]